MRRKFNLFTLLLCTARWKTSLNRFGQNYIGNEAMIEEATMLPKRFHSEDKDSEEKIEEE